MTTEQIDQSDQIYRWRRGTLMSVDDMIARIFGILDAYNETQNTYFFFTSDNVSGVILLPKQTAHVVIPGIPPWGVCDGLRQAAAVRV